jgi:uncharacterized repeat protein (TIGR01451 family)
MLLPMLLVPAIATAQQTDRPSILSLGNAVVTGFSGTVAPDPNKRQPPNKSVVDLTFIDLDGPSARVIDLSRPGRVWNGSVFAAPKTFNVLAKDVGQVFGVALDDAPQPNIYLAATSAFGLNLVARGRDGRPERRKTGGPGTSWMKGQFGLDLGGGPGAIYKVDGRTGVVTLFANVTLDGVPNPATGLGNLAYDVAHKQVFVSDLFTGMIHRFDLNGNDLEHYDHGVTGLGAAKLPTVAFDPKRRPNIASASFDSERPATWGFAPPRRRVIGLAMHEGRLYYSVASGPQIWSVGITREGRFGNDPRWELDVPAPDGALPVTDIAFSQKGAMILAQRAPVAGAYDYRAFTHPGEPRLLRFWLKDRNDPPSPGRWKPVPEEYAVGFAGAYRNTNGGIALGYGYDRQGIAHGDACEYSLWTTGQNLRNAPALRRELEPGGPLVVHGLMGMPASPVRSFNEPPWVSYSVDYDGRFDDPANAGHMGSVRIVTQPCAPNAVYGYGGPGYPGEPPFVVVDGGCVGRGCKPETPINLAIKKEAGSAIYDQKTGLWTVEFKIDVSNVGNPFSPGNAITVSDPVPAGLTFVSATGTNWTCGVTSGTLNCNYAFGSGSLGNGVHLAPLLVKYTTDKPGKYENCATVGTRLGSGFHETTLSDNKSCDTITVVRNVDIAIAKTGALTTVADMPRPGTTDITYTLAVTNVGMGFPGNGAITVSDTPPPGVTFTSVTSTSDWQCQLVSGAVQCTYIGAGPVNPGDALGSITVHAFATGKGPWENCATTAVDPATGSDTNPENNKSCVTMTPKPSYDISLAKSFGEGTGIESGHFFFTFKVKNEGDPITIGTSATTVRVTDTVPSGVTITGYGGTSASNWTCTPAFNVVGPANMTCTYTGSGSFATGSYLPDLVLTTTLNNAPNSSEQGVYTNCAVTGMTDSTGPVAETNTANNKSCAVTKKINEQDCADGGCPQPKAVCKQDVMFVVDASVSIGGGVGTVRNAIKNFLHAMQDHGGNADIISFNNGGIGTTNPSWIQITNPSWQLVTSANAGTLPNPISLGGTRTNWENALQYASTQLGSPNPPPLVIFITDGYPTAYQNGGVEVDGNTTPLLAAQHAVPFINAIRAAGSPFIAIGFNDAATTGYLDAAVTGNSSGPSDVNLETSSVIKMNDVSSLPGVLAALGNQMCGNLSLSKSVSNSYFTHVIPTGSTSVSVSDTLNYSLKLTNNSSSAVTGITVTDQVPVALTNVTVTAPTNGASPATPPGNLITWSGISLGAHQTATLAFTAKLVKTYTAPATETYYNYAQVSAADNYTATHLNNMNPVSGPVTEPDESVAAFTENIVQQTVNPCQTDNAPDYCFVSANKYRTNPGAEDGSCTSSPAGGPSEPCDFTINVNLSNIPAGSTVTLSDQLTLNGTPVTWPGSATPSTFCSPSPTTVSFTCTHTPATSFSGHAIVNIPPGQSGALKNCITVTVTNNTTSPPFNKTATACATVIQLTQPQGICGQTGDGKSRGDSRNCVVPPLFCPPPLVPGAVPGQCVCPDRMHLVDGKCIAPPPPSCPSPQVPGAVPGQCICPNHMHLVDGNCVAPPPPSKCRPPLVAGENGHCACPLGKVLRGKRCVEPVVCHAPARLNRRGTGCDCPAGMTRKGNTCVEQERKKPRERDRKPPGFSGEDVIRVLPGIIPGFGRGGRSRGGPDNGGHKGGGDMPRGVK